MTDKNPQPATAPTTGAIPAPKDKSGELNEADLAKVSGGKGSGDPCMGGDKKPS